MVGTIDTLTHSTLYMNDRDALQEYMRHTIIHRWNTVSQRADNLIMNWVESCCDVPGQLQTGDIPVIHVFHVQKLDGIFKLKELRWL
jgi:hypothetical protein